MSAEATILASPHLPKDRDGPVFAEPWQAQAFALTVRLHEAGHFTWPEWVEHLSREIADAPPSEPHEAEATYYLQWLAALEKLITTKGIASPAELARRKDEWREAYEETPFGQPVARDTHHHAHAHEHHHHHAAHGHGSPKAKNRTRIERKGTT